MTTVTDAIGLQREMTELVMLVGAPGHIWNLGPCI